MIKDQRLAMTVLRNMPVILFVLVFVFFSALDQRFFTVTNFADITRTASFVGIVAVGMTVVLLTGGIDLSVGAIMYIAAAVLALLLEQGTSLPIAIASALLAGTLWGAVNAFLIVRVGIAPFMATLATLTAGRGIGLLITESRHIAVPDEMRFGATQVLGLPIPIMVFLLVVAVAWLALRYTASGRQIYAIGYDADAARKAGLATRRLTAGVYVFSGLCAAVAAIVAVSQQGSVSSGFGEGVEFKAIAAAVLGGVSLFGGVGNVFPGTVIGVLLVQMIQYGLIYLQVDIYLQDMVAAGVIFFAVLVDALRIRLIRRLERRTIRVEKSPPTIQVAAAPP